MIRSRDLEEGKSTAEPYDTLLKIDFSICFASPIIIFTTMFLRLSQIYEFADFFDSGQASWHGTTHFACFLLCRRAYYYSSPVDEYINAVCHVLH